MEYECTLTNVLVHYYYLLHIIIVVYNTAAIYNDIISITQIYNQAMRL